MFKQEVSARPMSGATRFVIAGEAEKIAMCGTPTCRTAQFHQHEKQ